MEFWQNLKKKRNTDYDFTRQHTNKFASAGNNELRFTWAHIALYSNFSQYIRSKFSFTSLCLQK